MRHLTYNLVVSAAATRCADMDQPRQSQEQHGEKEALIEWCKFTDAHRWFPVPASIPTARTFVCDEIDAYYIDAMNGFRNRASSMNGDMNLEIIYIPVIS